ncbi:MAG: hypothetical protein LBQ95_02055 [Lachnospiraceae bacterium]|jgi:tellurite resistance protein TehA-like permease|nr:hypothetical protein [Lachnospiraceae bacterium]
MDNAYFGKLLPLLIIGIVLDILGVVLLAASVSVVPGILIAAGILLILVFIIFAVAKYKGSKK